MNDTEKEEAHRPRPLSAGIWTLFSWLRRSERSSSSESVSSVGSARTAASFDFLAPANCNITKTPIVLTTPVNPPTETYKRRLQDRKLRRERDRDVTLHRKYGLFREHGNTYDGFTLPVRWTLGNSLDRPSRERRANSECLQRRAAYVPGKRRAPLPPAITTSASLPRTYKRKRPAPKPPIKNTLKDNNIIPLINNNVRMTTNFESGAKVVPHNDLLNNSKPQKWDNKKVNSLKDTKSRTDKNFLKHIFENKKRSSALETTSVRLLPSISELDKQATEIIEKNKLRQNRNNGDLDNFSNLQYSNAVYEGNSWFCTTCLRKYNSSVDACNHCQSDKRHSLKNKDLKISPGPSVCTQTNINVETATSSRNSMDERKMLKEILKEMKDSLPNKNKAHKANVITETPTLRIGSTVQDTYKDFIPQPSSSIEIVHDNSRIFSISSQTPETQRSYDQKNITDKHKLVSAFKSKNNVQSTCVKETLNTQEHSSNAKNEYKEKNSHSSPLSNVLFSKPKNNTSQTTKITENVTQGSTVSANLNNLENINDVRRQFPLISTKTNDNTEISKANMPASYETSSDILGHRPNVFDDQNNVDNILKVQNQPSDGACMSVTTNISNTADQVPQKQCKLQFLNFSNSHSVVVNSVTVVTSHSSNNSCDKAKKASTENTENNPVQSSVSTVQHETNITDNQFQSPFQNNKNSPKTVKIPNHNLEMNANSVKPLEVLSDTDKPKYNLHIPLKISSLLNPLNIPNQNILKENISTGNEASKCLQKKPQSCTNALESTDNDKDNPKINKELHETVTPRLIFATSSASKTSQKINEFTETEIKERRKIEQCTKNLQMKDDVREQEAMPSTSSCFKIPTNNSNQSVDNYDQRRHLINQLEQSIAKGDEVAAAEAAVKLAKLRLSCSVLSFSSQIVGNSSNTTHNETNKQHISTINTTATKDKPLEQSIPRKPNEDIVEHIGIKTESVKTSENEAVLLKTDSTEGVKNNEANDKPALLTPEPTTTKDIVPINVWIEDKKAARGPIRLNISRKATVGDLRRQAEHSLGLGTQLQRWIVGRTLCSDDESPIISLAGPNFKAPFYLCIVQPDMNDKPSELNSDVIANKNKGAPDLNGEFYEELMKLEKQSLVPNIEPFECGVCMEECAVGAGVILRECIHTFCRECLSDVVQHSQEPIVACPAMGCSGFMQEREIRSIVTSEEYERWLARSLATAECRTRNAFHCRTRDCTGWAFCDPGVRRFPCPVCKNTNCVQCQAIHEGETCEEYRMKLREAVTAAETNKDDEGTQALLNSLILRGEALECPECKAIITKKWGCDWVKCSACKTEICWVTKGRRWGPSGRGDTSGGCRCGIDGQRCHPSCGYCH